MSHAWTADVTPQGRPPASFDALFSYGFRPFFLGASLFALILMAVWLSWLASVASGQTNNWLPVTGSPFAWHAHEMVYGFSGAAIAGFLLTAVPNWTGALPLSGAPLVFLFVLWLAGRVTMLVSGLLPYWLPAVVDVAFLPVLGGFAARQLFVKPAARNLVFLVILTVLGAGNLVFHLATLELIAWEAGTAMRMSLLMVTIMISIIGGRIIPAFTHNWLHLEAIEAPRPRRIPWLDLASIVAIALFALAFAFRAPDTIVSPIAFAAAVLNGARLILWRPFAVRREPILWVLHLGYAWLVAGLALAALSALTVNVPMTLAFHALGTGAVGTMILAVMSRASLGHTGRPLAAPRPVVWAYALVTLAAVLRVAGPIGAPSYTALAHLFAGLAWMAAFTLFAIVYAPILTTPRVHTQLLKH